MTFMGRFSNGMSAAVLSAVLGVSAGGLILGATMVPAAAQTVGLSADQIAAIQQNLSVALQNAHDNAAIEAAISQAVQSAVALYGAGAAGAITSTVMDTAEQAHVAPALIGNGLARASAALAGANITTAANAIATTIANEGDAGERGAYQSTSNSLGYTNLASLAGQTPTVTGGTGQGGIGAGGTGGGATGGGTGGQGGGGCLNPSCTHL